MKAIVLSIFILAGLGTVTAYADAGGPNEPCTGTNCPKPKSDDNSK